MTSLPVTGADLGWAVASLTLAARLAQRGSGAVTPRSGDLRAAARAAETPVYHSICAAQRTGRICLRSQYVAPPSLIPA